MASAVSICSAALLLLGDSPISDFSQDNARTRLVSNIYYDKRDAVLRAYPWNCATKRVVLSPEVAGPAFDWSYQFNLPGDWLRTINVGDDDDPDDFEEASGKILMDSNVCKLKYIFQNDVESTWDALLVEAMTQVMVAYLTYPITKSTAKQQTEAQIVRAVVQNARTVDGQSNPPETLGDFPILANRVR